MARRVLVVEDEMTIAFLIEDMLAELGCRVIGPAMRLPQAMEIARTEDIDLALLDVNLDGHPSFPVADILMERSVRIIFVTGYGRAGLEPAYTGQQILTKPFRLAELKAAIDAALSIDGGPPG